MAEGLKRVGEGAVFKRVKKEDAPDLDMSVGGEVVSQSVSNEKPKVSRAEALARLEALKKTAPQIMAGGSSASGKPHRTSKS